MPIDLAAAEAFLATHARLLDRRRFAVRFRGAPPGAALAALDAHRNADGGYGWGIEPDLRAPESHPAGALHAFEVLEDIAPATSPRGAELCAWLERATLPDGGLPFAGRVSSDAGVAPFWASADPERSSLHITAAVTGSAWRVARHDPAVAESAWLGRATRYCLDAAAAVEEPASMHALELRYTLAFLDAVSDHEPSAAALLDRLAAAIPPSGELHVQGGAEDELMRPLDFAPRPGRPMRSRVRAEAVAADLDRVAAGQRDDGGWEVDFGSFSPAAALEWRGYMTVHALVLLQANGRLG